MPLFEVPSWQWLEVGDVSYKASITITDASEALRALQNPKLFTSDHYKQAALAVAAGIAIQLVISIPVGSLL